ncbi:hypothetical protein QJQ45_001092 [Haematococcus lacustris]|nr:hypothetical protein QJQ45_001092 [Haematococcus lacustris]
MSTTCPPLSTLASGQAQPTSHPPPAPPLPTLDPAAPSSPTAQEPPGLRLDVQLEEGVTLAQLGHLKHWAQDTCRAEPQPMVAVACVWRPLLLLAAQIELVVPPLVPAQPHVVDTIRLAGACFPQLTQLTVSASDSSWTMGQAVVGAAAELLGLRRLVLDGGLRQLTELRVLPACGQGLEDTAFCEGLAALTSLQVLVVGGCPCSLTDVGLGALSRLTALRNLSLTPLGPEVTHASVATLCDHLPLLQRLEVGCSQGPQLEVLHPAVDRVASLCAVVADPELALAPLLTNCTLCLADQLRSLRLTSVKADDGAFLVAIGALTQLTQLCLTVAPARLTTAPFRLHLTALSKLVALQTIEVSVVGHRVLLPLSIPTAQLLTRSWPHLSSCSLSCMVPPVRLPALAAAGAAGSAGAAAAEGAAGRGAQGSPGQGGGQQMARWWGPVNPQALPLLCGGFSGLSQLALFAPLMDEDGDDTSSSGSDVEDPGYGDEEAEEGEEGVEEEEVEKGGADGAPSTSGWQLTHTSSTKQEMGGRGQLRVLLDWLPPTLTKLVLEHAVLRPGKAGGATPGGRLAKLASVELCYCQASDACMSQLFSAAPHLTHLDLTEVRGLSSSAMHSLAQLTRLERLEVRDTRPTALLPTPGPGAWPGQRPPPHDSDWSARMRRSSHRYLKAHLPSALQSQLAAQGKPDPDASSPGKGGRRSSSAGGPSLSLSSWWSWLTGWDTDPDPGPLPNKAPGDADSGSGSPGAKGQAGPAGQPEGQPRAARQPPPRLCNADFALLGNVVTLRRLHWQLAGPIAPTPLATPPAAALTAGMGPGGRTSADTGAPGISRQEVVQVLEQLKDLQLLYLYTDPADRWAEQAEAAQLEEGAEGVGGSAVLVTHSADGMGPAWVPAWLAAAVPRACRVLGHEPMMEVNVWTGTEVAASKA